MWRRARGSVKDCRQRVRVSERVEIVASEVEVFTMRALADARARRFIRPSVMERLGMHLQTLAACCSMAAPLPRRLRSAPGEATPNSGRAQLDSPFRPGSVRK